MKAIILAAGVGKRLSPYTEHSPKCLIEIGGRTLLERMLSSLHKVGVKEVFIVVGHLKDKIKDKMGAHYLGLSIHTIENSRYHEGSILSLWAARDVLKDADCLVLDADVLFPTQALKRLVESPQWNCFLVDDHFQDSGEEMKLGIRNGRVCEIARKLSRGYEKNGEGVGFLKVSKEDGASLVERLEHFYSLGRTFVEYEELLNEWLQDVVVGYEKVGDLPWTEIDFYDDVRKAWFQILPKIEALEQNKISSFNRKISNYFTKLFLKTCITPNQITTLSFLSGLLALFFFSRGDYGFNVLGAFFFQTSYVLDNCDGEVARAKGLTTRWGSWLDIVCDAIVHVCFFSSVAWGIYCLSVDPAILIWGNIASLGALIIFLSFMFKRMFKARQRSGFIRLVLPPSMRRGVINFLKSGDFSLWVLLISILGLLKPFLMCSAVGLHIFWVAVWSLNIEETSVG